MFRLTLKKKDLSWFKCPFYCLFIASLFYWLPVIKTSLITAVCPPTSEVCKSKNTRLHVTSFHTYSDSSREPNMHLSQRRDEGGGRLIYSQACSCFGSQEVLADLKHPRKAALQAEATQAGRGKVVPVLHFFNHNTHQHTRPRQMAPSKHFLLHKQNKFRRT